MVQPSLIAPFNVVSLMSEAEARECVKAINGHMNSARALLLDLYERRGWEALGYQSWRECVTAEFEGSQARLYQQLQAAQIERRISTNVEIGTIPEGQLRPLTRLTPMEQPIAWQEANERTEGKPTARVVEEVVREMRADPVNDEFDPPMEPAQARDIRDADRKPSRINAGMFTSATPEWYTPAHIIERVEAVFGHIDLDPCSNSSNPNEANVPALNYWTQADNGLVQPWHGKVYMNPPYGDEIAGWVGRLLGAKETGEIYEAIALLPARTDTAWFQPLFSYPICFVKGRLKFSGAENSAPFPSAIVYLGDDIDLFRDWFHTLGPIVKGL